MSTHTASSNSSELQSLQRAIQSLLEGMQLLVKTAASKDEKQTVRTEINGFIQYTSGIVDWCGKVPPQRIRETLISLIKHVYGFLTDAVKSGLLNPPKGDQLSLLPRLREVLMELGPNLTVSSDKMAAFVSIPDQLAMVWTTSDILEYLKDKGIVYGIDEKSLTAIFAEEKFDQCVRVALGKPPLIGSNAILEDPLQLLSKSHEFLQKNTKKIDYKSQNLFKPVKEGDVILKKIPPKKGENGCDIYGKEIVSPTGIDIEMPLVENCQRDESKLQLISKVDGCAYVERDQIFVTPALAIKGNVDFESGNVKTNVSVTVSHDVLSSFKVESEQDVAVNGVIEAAEIFARGSVFCQKGINGKESAVIRAGKNVETGHINSAKVSAGGYVTVKGPIIKSDVSARRVLSEGKSGQIMGGRISAWEDICANEIGSDMGASTELVLGQEVKALKNRVDEIADRIKTIKHEKAQSDRALKQLRSSGNAPKTEINKLAKQLLSMNKEVDGLQTRFDNAIRALAYSESCVRMVRATKVIYAGTRIRILDRSITIKEKRGPTTVMYANNKLVTLPYRDRSFDEGEDDEGIE